MSTHFLGAALLRGEWESAVSKILDPRDVMRKAREYYEESNDIEGTLRQLPRHLVAERDVIVSFRLSLLHCKFLYLTS